MSVQASTSEETKKETPPQTDDDAKKIEKEEVPSSPANEPGKKRRKLNDGSSIKADEPTGFLSSVSNFFSGTWFWQSVMSANPDTPSTGATAKDKTAEKEEPAELTKAEEGSTKPTAPTEKIRRKEESPTKLTTTCEKAADEETPPKDSATVTNSSDDNDGVEQNGDDADDKAEAKEPAQGPPDQKKNGTRGKPGSSKAVTSRGSKKRRR